MYMTNQFTGHLVELLLKSNSSILERDPLSCLGMVSTLLNVNTWLVWFKC